MKRTTTALIVPVLLSFAAPAFAQLDLDSYYTGSDVPRIDARFDEWADEEGNSIVSFLPLEESDRVGGEGAIEGPEDIGGELAIAHNDKFVFGAFKVADQRFIRTKKLTTAEDHIQLWFATGTGDKAKVHGIGIYADPSRYKGPVEVRWLKPGSSKAGGKVKGATAAVDGDEFEYQIEISIPWKAFIKKGKARKNLGLAVYFVDGDMAAHMSQKNILGTAPVEALKNPAEIPRLLQGDLGAGLSAFADSMGLSSDEPEAFKDSVNIAGDKTPEELMVVANYLVANGGAVQPGSYVYTQLPVKDSDQVLSMKTKDLLGNKRAEIILTFREINDGNTREWMEVYRMQGDMSFQKIFSAATKVEMGSISIENSVKFAKGPGKSKAIKVLPGPVKGVDEKTIGDNIPEEDGNYMVMPWDKPAKLKYVFKGDMYQTK